jgi:NDP-sugar pyrophosphorylase family protein
MIKVMIFAAGLGTRLKPLTDSVPKALVELNGIPILEHTIRNLKQQGFTDLVINVHHFADQIEDFLKERQNFGLNIKISDERDLLLETGGALLNAKNLLQDSEHILIHNADIISDIDLRKLITDHIKNEALASLAVQNRESSRKLLFDEDNFLCAWKNIITGEEKISRDSKGNLHSWAFSGIHILDPGIFESITEKGKFSIIDLYLRLAKDHKISACKTDHSYWFDLGRPENLAEAERHLKNK